MLPAFIKIAVARQKDTIIDRDTPTTCLPVTDGQTGL